MRDTWSLALIRPTQALRLMCHQMRGNGTATAGRPGASQHHRASGHPERRDAECTQGEWTGEPTSYAYAWQVNGVGVGTDAATYDVQAADVGGEATCTVTATNAAGSAAAPPSVGVVVA